MNKFINNNITKTYFNGRIIKCITYTIDKTIKEVIFNFNPDMTIMEGDNFKIQYKINSIETNWDILVSIDDTPYSIHTELREGYIYPNELRGENLPQGLHAIQIIIYENEIIIGRVIYSIMITSITESIIISERNRLPYISTYNINPIVNLNEDIQIELYMDDYYGSYYKETNMNQKFKLYVYRDGEDAIIYNNLSGGDRFVSIGSFDNYGIYNFGLQCEDEQGRKSHVLWNEVWVKPPIEENVYQVTEEDLDIYRITNKKIENIVPIYITENEYTNYETLRDNQSTIIGNKQEVIDYIVPSGQYTVFLADLDNDGQYDYWPGWLRTNPYIKYADDYNQKTIDTIATNNQQGLQRLIDDKIAEGYNKIILPKDNYFIVAHRDIQEGEGRGSYGSIYIEADNFTLDLNGSTIKLNSFTGSSTLIVSLCCSFNSHIINGNIEGDVFTHDYANSPNNSEWVNLAGISGGCGYCSMENLTLLHSSGYGYIGGLGANRSDTKYITAGGDTSKSLGVFTDGDLDSNGELIEASDRCVCDFVDVSFIVREYKKSFNTNYGMFQISIYLGYQGNGMSNWCFKLCSYDENYNYLDEQIGYQYRNLKVPPNTKYIRVVAFASSANVVSNLKAVYFYTPYNCISRNLIIKEIRGTGGAWSQQRNCLFENMDFINCGNNVTPVGFDMEDGWDMMMDATYRNVNFYNRLGTADLMFCAGHNMIVENMIEGSCYIYNRSRNYVIRNCSFTQNNTLHYDSLLGTGTPRIYNNTSNIENIDDGVVIKDSSFDHITNGSCIRCEMNSLRNNKQIKNSTLNVVAEPQHLEAVFLESCECKSDLGVIRFKFNTTTGLHYFYDCDFKNYTEFANHNYYYHSYCENCRFYDGLFIQPNVNETEGIKLIEFKDCIINITQTDKPLIQTAPFSYNIGSINIKFTNCTINNIGCARQLIYDNAQSPNGDIVFDNCTINNQINCKLFDWYLIDNRTYENLNIKFINTTLPSNIDISNIENIDGINIIIE